MRDGTRVTGGIAATSATEISVNPDAGGSRTIPMKDVRRVDYGEIATAARPAAPAQSQPVPAPPPAPEPTHEDHYHPPATAVQSRTRVLAAGTELPVRNEETIDSGKAVEGQTYAAEVAADVRDADGAVVIPRGSNTQLVIKSATKGGRFRGSSDLVVDLTSVSIDGQQYRLDVSDISEKGRSGLGANKRTGEMVGVVQWHSAPLPGPSRAWRQQGRCRTSARVQKGARSPHADPHQRLHQDPGRNRPDLQA